jgi:hypothetical protein
LLAVKGSGSWFLRRSAGARPEELLPLDAWSSRPDLGG